MSSDEDRLTARLLRIEGILVKHSMFAYPHLWLWHALFDGTCLCRCWHSKKLKDFRARMT